MSEECTKVKEYLIKIGFLIKDFTIYLYLKIFNILSISTTLINLICFNAAKFLFKFIEKYVKIV